MADVKRTCKASGCARALVARELCGAHYMEAKRAGTLPQKWDRWKKPAEDLETRLAARTDRSDADGCWLWTGSVAGTGYGAMRIAKRLVPAHRVAYTLAHGPIPDGMHVDHECRNRACVNPAHLRVVTHAQNQQNRNVRRDSTSGFRNVFWHPRDKRWEVRVRLDGVLHFGGSFASKDDAAIAARALRQKLYTHCPD